MIIAGLDIGTTSISAIVIESDTGEVLESVTIPNQAGQKGRHTFEKLQDPEEIVSISTNILDKIIKKHNPKSIGLTGQMHGILYVDENGLAVSPLITWQDGRGEQSINDSDISYTQVLTNRVDELSNGAQYSPLASGYGAVTHFYNSINTLIPPKATEFCTIQCYVAMRLCNRKTALLHASDASSFGLYDLQKACFAQDAIIAGEMDFHFFPDTTTDNAIMGSYNNIPISIGIGDNQASFLGTVKDAKNSVLVNIGTGSQISLLSDSCFANAPIEARPFINKEFIQVGASLCGGESYALLNEFYSQVVKMATGENTEKLYEKMNDAALAYIDETEKLAVSTLFRGTRQDSSVRGKITNISTANFTPQMLTLGFLEGVVNALWDMYLIMEPDKKRSILVGSGNAIRNNPALRKILEARFGLELLIPTHKEEAAFGAAIFGYDSAFDAAQTEQCIKYL